MTDHSQPEIVRLTIEDWPSYRALRLEALTDAPWAFGSTLAREMAFNEADYHVRLSQRAQWAARVDGKFVGTVGAIQFDVDAPPELISMWVRPQARGRGIGDLLVRTVLDWAREQGFEQVRLFVTEGNDRAERLYARNGFVRTGEVKNIRPEEPGRMEVGMDCELAKPSHRHADPSRRSF
jgi:ribosomal protein S18 acetylase RimI-like enzyme